MRVKSLFLLLIIVIIFACSPSKRFNSRNDDRLIGVASYYGPGFHGKKTASGEIFDMYKMTCAHRTLPFGTMLLVTNLTNNKSVKVRVNDRGPFIEGVILDLSKGAADKIGLKKRQVEIKIVSLGR